MMRIICFGWALCCLIVASCTLDPSTNTLKNTVPLLNSAQWKTTSYPTQNRKKRCVVSAGFNALEVIMESKGKQTSPTLYVKSTRPIRPDTVFVIKTNGKIYRAPRGAKLFSPQKSQAIVNDLLAEKRVYLNWRGMYDADQNITNYIKESRFTEPYQKCQKLLNSNS